MNFKLNMYRGSKKVIAVIRQICYFFMSTTTCNEFIIFDKFYEISDFYDTYDPALLNESFICRVILTKSYFHVISAIRFLIVIK